jgi:flagellar basal-body rod modification protein FlgD
MTTVQNTGTGNISSLFGQTASSTTTSSTTDKTNQFLSLLVAQMQNQDPTHPLDNAQVTSQLAQLSTVQGIDNVNSTLKSLASSLGGNQIGQAANLIGHSVLVPGSSISPTSDGKVLGFDLSRPADTVKLSIQNAAGATVRTLNLGSRDSGVNVLAWDGLDDNGAAVADGSYSFKIDAVQGGIAVDNTSLSLGTVNSVSAGSSGVQLNLSSHLQAGYADVRQIF